MNFSGKRLDLTTPQVMGIINLAPDSFSPIGRCEYIDLAVAYGIKLAAQGAAIIDIGGEPTHPRLHPVTPVELELQRVVPVVQALSQEISIPISVDTSKPDVMAAVLKAGASMLNDVRAFREPKALAIAAEANVPICVMYMRYPDGISHTQQQERPVREILSEVKAFLAQRVELCLKAGVKKEHIIIDPGIGFGHFGKSTAENLYLLKHLDVLKTLGFPILVGTSRKTFIGDVLNVSVEQRLSGSLASAMMAVHKGATIIRAHDVEQTIHAMRMTQAILEAA
jgi:dihydropteroate synthase